MIHDDTGILSIPGKRNAMRRDRGGRERETERQKEEGVREHVLNFKSNVSRGATPDSWAV
jgi:hypothetical protein